MGSHWWQRLFSRRARAAPDQDDAEPDAGDTGADAATAVAVEDEASLRERFAPPAEGDAAPTPYDGGGSSLVIAEDEPAPAVDPRLPMPAADVEPHAASSASLGRSMAWRVRVLLDGANDEAKRSDGPALVEVLLEGGASFISQPPAAALRALQVTRNPNSSLAQIVELFESDPMLAQALLKMSNSAYYRIGEDPVVSLGEAVRRVGLQVVQGVLMASMVENMLCRPGSAFDSLVRQVWSHMQRTAPVARCIAPAFGVHPDHAFALALLHDVGKLVIFDNVSTLRREKKRDLRIPAPFFRQVLMHLHEPVGGQAMLRWGMGGEAAYAIGEHHRRPVPDSPDPVTETLFVAEAVELAQTNAAPFDWDGWWTRGGITADRVAVQERLAALQD